MATIAPRPEFDWVLVNWGGPDQPRAENCAYCGDQLPEESCHLIIGREDGWVAEFCDHCATRWWGLQSLEEAEPQDEPEVAAANRRQRASQRRRR